MDYILNELSIPNGKTTVADARRLMAEFIVTSSTLRSIGFTALRIQSDLYAIALAENYMVSQWITDPEVDRDYARRFKSISKNSPYIPDTAEEANETFANSDFYHKGSIAIGLGVAYLLGTVTISFQTGADWLYTLVDIDHHMLNENGDLGETRIRVRNAFDRESANSHKEWFEEERLKNLSNSAELWKRRAELFNKLVFCDCVESQLSALSLNDQGTNRIIERLLAVNEYCTTWVDGPFDHSKVGFKISGESGATLDKFGEERTFRIPSGEYKLFADHFKLGDIRIHFYVDDARKRVYIGYIGKHLPTVRFN